ncbi:hypothetical protein [Aurantivibrio infirmus]
MIISLPPHYHANPHFSVDFIGKPFGLTNYAELARLDGTFNNHQIA